MYAILDDVRYSLRSLRRTPGFAVVAALVLALGIGATTAIFSVLSAVVLRPVPFPDGHRVVNLAWNYGAYVSPNLTAAKFSYWQERTRSLGTFASWQPFFGRVGEVGEITGAQGLRVTAGFFGVLGISPTVGRAFAEDEYRPGGARVAVVSPGFWREHFGEQVDVSGRISIRLEEEPYVIIGLLPEDFAFPYVSEPVEMIVPTEVPPVDPDDHGENWPAIARLGEDYTMSDARTEVASLNAGFGVTYPQQAPEAEPGMVLDSFAELYVGQTANAIWMLMGAVMAVLLITCANVGNLFLARALRRRGEMALCAALGATESRIMRLGMAEAVAVASAAGVVGVALAVSGANVLVALAPVQLPLAGSITVDWRVVAFTIAVSLAAAIVVSLVAAWPAVRGGLWRALRQGSRTTTGQRRLQEALVAGQTALSTILLVAAGLLFTTWSNLRQVDPGFDPEALVAVKSPIRPPNYDTSEELDQFAQGVVEGVRTSEGIDDVAGASSLPFERGLNVPISIAGRDEFGGSVELRTVTRGYFETLAVPVVRGRSFTPADVRGAVPVAIVNETFARNFFPGGDAVGQRIDLGRINNEYRPSLAAPGILIVGVAADVQDVSFRTAVRRTMYLPHTQVGDYIANIRPTLPVFVVRSTLAVERLDQAFGQAIRTVDPALPGPDVFPLSETVAETMARERFGALLVALFGALSLILTAVGVYAVLAQAVRSRRREIGIRMAIGASGGQVLRLVVVRGLLPVVVGIGVGLAGAIVLSGLMEAYLWGITGTDARTLGVAAASILIVATVACWIPAREATGVDPVTALAS